MIFLTDKCLSLKSTINAKKDKEKEPDETKIEKICHSSEKENSNLKNNSFKEKITCDKYFEKLSNASESMSEEEIYRTRCKEHMDDKESFFPATTDSENETVTTLNKKKQFRNSNSPMDESNFSAKDYELIEYFQTHGDFYKFHQAIDFSDLDEKRGKFIDNPNFKNKIKSEQNLSHGIWQNFRNSEPMIPINQRRCVTSYSKKKNECPHGKDEMTDSEFAFLWPEQKRTRRKSSHGYSQKLIDERRNRSCDLEKRNISQHLQKIENRADYLARFNESKQQNCKQLCQENVKSFNSNGQEEVNSPRTETDIASENPKRIPYKTQKLLSKSYWDYYRKLNKNMIENPQRQCCSQISSGNDQIKKGGSMTIYEEQSELSPPEIRTLKRCSVLSSMINKKL